MIAGTVDIVHDLSCRIGQPLRGQYREETGQMRKSRMSHKSTIDQARDCRYAVTVR